MRDAPATHNTPPKISHNLLLLKAAGRSRFLPQASFGYLSSCLLHLKGFKYMNYQPGFQRRNQVFDAPLDQLLQ
jgi:hypothetical protein